MLTWIMPVASADVSTVIGGNTAGVDDNRKDDEARAGNDLDDRKNEFNFPVATHAEELNGSECHEENGHPNANVDVCRCLPVRERQASGRDFEGEDGEPVQSPAVSRQSSFRTRGPGTDGTHHWIA